MRLKILLIQGTTKPYYTTGLEVAWVPQPGRCHGVCGKTFQLSRGEDAPIRKLKSLPFVGLFPDAGKEETGHFGGAECLPYGQACIVTVRPEVA
ncbi:hypothetical protein NKDENANG_03905 [Candidatus Entotheonellaceae bacterium PAL068K]